MVGHAKPGYVGRAAAGVEMKIADDGEVLARGGNMFEGYLGQPDKTAETIDDDGWVHTGDIGEIDDDGYLKIVDRKKELIITAGGKNISPANLEAELKMIPLVGQACAVGDEAAVRVRHSWCSIPMRRRSWANEHGLEGDDADADGDGGEPRGDRGDRRRPGRGDGELQQRRVGEEGQGARRRMVARHRPVDADVEAQAARHPRGFADEIESLYAK